LDFASRQTEAETGFGYFGTSIANFLLFEDDLRKLNRIHHTYLAGLAYLGLGQVFEAMEAFEQVLALDVNHLGAQEELKRLTGNGKRDVKRKAGVLAGRDA
jgi:tetratricopeptide (TPR) repeat protein